jgi:hypothetical protein
VHAFLETKRGRWILFIVGWTALSLLFAPEAYLSFRLRRTPISWSETLQLTLVNAALALLFMPAIIALARRFPFERRHLKLALLVHIPACLAFSLAHSGLYAILCHASDVGGTLFYRFHPNLLSYCAVAGFTQAFDYFQRYQQRERDISQLQLESLKSQLQPHFLFNALHTISAMMHVEPKSADRMMSRLSDLLRLTLGTIGKHEVTLAEEITFVEAYMEIERVRFGERLAMRVEAQPDALQALVPVLFLQPLVENCVRHGFVPMTHNSLIVIRAQRRDATLVLSVTDNGRGLPHAQIREGIGIANSRRRLTHLYPNAQAGLHLQANEPNGATVTIEIPYHTVPVMAALQQESTEHEHPSVDRRRRALGQNPHQYAPQR